MAIAKRVITIPADLDPVSALGPGDAVLAEVEHAFPKVDILVRGNRIELSAYSARDDAQAGQAAGVLEDIISAAYKAPVEASVVRRMLERNAVGRGHGHRLQGEAKQSVSRGAVPSAHNVNASNTSSREASNRADGTNSTEANIALSNIGAMPQDDYDYDAARTRQGQASSADEATRPGQTYDSDAVYAPSPLSRQSHARHGRHAAPSPDGPDTTSDFGYVAKSVQQGASTPAVPTSKHRSRIPGIITMAAGEPVRAKTAGQVAYVGAIEEHTITFGIGPAGTGKTYLAVAKAVRAFEDGRVSRIILTRPAVEAGESLGFLPGTLSDKVDPYLRPLYDALSDMLGVAQLHRYMNDGSIEVAPLAYMRGRTLNDAFVILDEAQNTTEQQMKMFLTRLGFNTKMVITGDITQVDLAVRHSGLGTIERILGRINDISFVHLDERDVVRHALVGKIVAAYNTHDEQVQRHREQQKAALLEESSTVKKDKGHKSAKKKHKKAKDKRSGDISEGLSVSGSAEDSSRTGLTDHIGISSDNKNTDRSLHISDLNPLSEAYAAGSFNEGQGSGNGVSHVPGGSLTDNAGVYHDASNIEEFDR